MPALTLARDYNHGRFEPDTTAGFYESYFQRANHPTRPLAFWIRYTVFCPRGRPEDAIGELWAVFFDGEKQQHVVVKTEVPAGQFTFGRDALNAHIAGATLEPGQLKGEASTGGHNIEWDLSFSGTAPPLFLLPPPLYATGFPKAKTLVGLPMALYRGTLIVDGRVVAIDGWVGSQNHNWGAKHTDRYAWGQVAGFDNAPESFLEVATGQLKVGPFWTPRMTPVVLRHGGEEYALRSIGQALTGAEGYFGYFHWRFRSHAPGVVVEGAITAPKEAFVGLRYYNPPGGEKWCLNSKLASCKVTLQREGKRPEILETRHRAAFEILTDDLAHGVEIRT